MTIRAAGVVLLRHVDTGPEALLVHRPRHKDWSLPKGKLHPGEPLLLAAIRECEEETGYRPALGPRLGRQRYKVEGRRKVVDYWTATVGAQTGFRPDEEVDAAEWFPVERAVRRVTYRRDAKLIENALAVPPTSPFIVLRHALSVKRGQFHGKDAKRPLSSRGREQARRIAGVLQGYDLERIHSSNWSRCLQTMEPFADASGVPVKKEKDLNEAAFDRDPKAAAKRTRALAERDRAAVVCGHRPVLPTMLRQLDALPGFDRRLATSQLSMAGMIIVHRYRRDDGWHVTQTERHEDF